ncbi:MAG: zinc-dependent alcohol dehydrogenase family protein [Phycisphaerales bacterium]|nr:zinc-dependent alcohol dehydrogenase family protein [Phycisphaerales bacterium]
MSDLHDMRALVLHTPAPAAAHPLRLEHRPVPVPGPGEVLVRVAACGVCRTDLHVVEGDLPPRRPTIVPGHQVVGVVVAVGPEVEPALVGQRVGIAWVHRTCGTCRFCTSGRENLCDRPDFTGWTVDGGYAEFATAPATFVHRLPRGLSDEQVAPLLCAGIIGYRALALTGLDQRPHGWRNARLGLYGFGAAGHLAIQLARRRGADVYVCTRDRERHQALAKELGAVWVGDAAEQPPEPLDAAVIFAPAGELVPPALEALDKGGTLVLGGIHMSDVPPLEYRLLYQERVVRSVANNTRNDAQAFLAEAAEAHVRTSVQTFPFDRANEALEALRNDAIRGAAVLRGWSPSAESTL